jgi:hypothetical protein
MSALANLSRAERRHAEAYMKRENAKWPGALKEWPREEWPSPNPKISRVWRSRGFLVQEHPAPAPAIVRLSILRTALEAGGGWKQDITWEELQRLKREAGFGDFEAVEVFPPDRDVVNVANIRHLFVLPAGHLEFAWRATP